MLETLHDVSLVQRHVVGGETRFVLLETIREFALEGLTGRRAPATDLQREEAHALGSLVVAHNRATQGRTQTEAQAYLDHLRCCHAAFFLGFAEQATAALAGPEWAGWIHHFKTEHANLRVALETLIEGRDAQRALRLAAALWQY